MPEPETLVVGETPSLGRSVGDLLEASGVRVRVVEELPEPLPRECLRGGDPVVVLVCSGPICRSARRWVRGDHPDVRVVVIGSRDPILAQLPAAQLLPLPVNSATLLRAVLRRTDPMVPPVAVLAARPL